MPECSENNKGQLRLSISSWLLYIFQGILFLLSYQFIDVKMFIILSYYPLSLCRVYIDVLSFMLILVICVFPLFFPWSTWLEVYQLYWSFQGITFNIIDLSLFLKFYWFLLFVVSLPLLALVLIWSLLLIGILDYWLKILLSFQCKHLMLYIFLLAISIFSF